MKITRGSDQLGTAIPRQASIDSSMRSAYRAGPDAIGAFADGLESVSKTMIGLERAEEDAKVDELKSKYQIEYNERSQQLKQQHLSENLSAADYDTRHQQILDDLHSKYSTAYDFNTEYGTKFTQFLDLDKEAKRVGAMGTVQEIAMQNQSISWAKGEQNRLNAAIGGDYQNLTNQIAEQRKIYQSPAYMVAHGEKAIANEAAFVDAASEQWMERAILGGSNPRQMLANLQNETMFQGVSAEKKTDMAVKLNKEVKRQEAEAEKIAKKQAEQRQIDMVAQNIALSGVFNPDDKMQQKAFKQTMDRIAQNASSPGEAMRLQQNYRIELGYIEPEAVGQMNAALMSRDPNIANLAVQQANYYLSENPTMARHFAKYKGLTYVANLTASGIDVATAVEMHREMAGMPEDRKKELRKLGRDSETLTSSVDTITDRVRETFDGDSFMGLGGWSDENIEKVQDRAKQLFPEFYTLYQGNTEAAERAVVQQIAQSHAITNIGGKETVMYRAPATFLPKQGKPGEEEAVIKEMYEADLNSLALPNSIVTGSSIAFTGKKSKNGNPIYSINYQNEPVKKDGKVIEWEFDPAEAMKKRQEVEVQKLQEQRDENMGKLSKPVQAATKKRDRLTSQLERLKADRRTDPENRRVDDKLISDLEKKIKKLDEELAR